MKQTTPSSFLSRFELARHQTTPRREIIAGLTTFAAMAYILAVNPQILSESGMDRNALVTATALSAAIMTAAMALYTNYPIALAPGMGLNAFFTYTICLQMEIPWQAALAIVFLGGLIFLLATWLGLRESLMNAIPHELKIAITCGIGLFIAFIGLKNGGIITSNAATYVSLGDLSEPGPLLVLAGIVGGGVLLQRNIRAGIIYVIIAITAVGLIMPRGGDAGFITNRPDAIFSLPSSLSPIFMKFDFGYVFSNLVQTLPLILAFVVIDLFDTMGTLIGVTQRCGLLDAKGTLPKLNRALTADAGATLIGATLGTSTVTSYVESAAGVEAGGRTGLTTLTVAACFVIALFLTPLIVIIPPEATAPALILVGVYMMQGITTLNLDRLSTAIPVVLTLIIMPLAYSISAGIAVGFVVMVLLKLGSSRRHELSPMSYALGILLSLYLIFLRG